MVQFQSRMNLYELTVVIPGTASAQKKKSAQDTIEKLVKVNQGQVKNLEDLGKIDLAYPIQKNDTGLFMRFDVEMEGEGAKAINNRLRAEDEFIRYLLVKKETHKIKTEKSKTK